MDFFSELIHILKSHENLLTLNTPIRNPPRQVIGYTPTSFYNTTNKKCTYAWTFLAFQGENRIASYYRKNKVKIKWDVSARWHLPLKDLLCKNDLVLLDIRLS